jgi:hypothetical protein
MKKSKKPKITSKPFDAEDVADINGIAEAGLKLLKLKPSDSAEAKVKKLTKLIDEHLHKKTKKNAKALENLASQLGCLYGNILRDEMGWEWCVVNDDGDEFLAVGPADKSVLLAPIGYLHSQMTAPVSGDNTSMLLFNMIKAGTIYKGKPGEYAAIG